MGCFRKFNLWYSKKKSLCRETRKRCERFFCICRKNFFFLNVGHQVNILIEQVKIKIISLSHFLSLSYQFVPFRDYMDRTGNHVLSMARLAKDVLAEIPDQFISYMKSRGIKPNPAPPPYTPPGHTHHHTQI